MTVDQVGPFRVRSLARAQAIAELGAGEAGAELDQLSHCECGIPLELHPPLRRPGPLRSWHAARSGGEPGARPFARGWRSLPLRAVS